MSASKIIFVRTSSDSSISTTGAIPDAIYALDFDVQNAECVRDGDDLVFSTSDASASIKNFFADGSSEETSVHFRTFSGADDEGRRPSVDICLKLRCFDNLNSSMHFMDLVEQGANVRVGLADANGEVIQNLSEWHSVKVTANAYENGSQEGLEIIDTPEAPISSVPQDTSVSEKSIVSQNSQLEIIWGNKIRTPIKISITDDVLELNAKSSEALENRDSVTEYGSYIYGPDYENFDGHEPKRFNVECNFVSAHESEHLHKANVYVSFMYTMMMNIKNYSNGYDVRKIFSINDKDVTDDSGIKYLIFLTSPQMSYFMISWYEYATKCKLELYEHYKLTGELVGYPDDWEIIKDVPHIRIISGDLKSIQKCDLVLEDDFGILDSSAPFSPYIGLTIRDLIDITNSKEGKYLPVNITIDHKTGADKK